MRRCSWPQSELDIAYHDREWGVPVHDDRIFFEFLTLEGAQAGLSWSTILRKRENYRRAFARFDPMKVSRFSKAKISALMRDEGIVRNRLKIESTVTNARAFRPNIGSAATGFFHIAVPFATSIDFGGGTITATGAVSSALVAFADP